MNTKLLLLYKYTTYFFAHAQPSIVTAYTTQIDKLPSDHFQTHIWQSVLHFTTQNCKSNVDRIQSENIKFLFGTFEIKIYNQNENIFRMFCTAAFVDTLIFSPCLYFVTHV